MSSKRCLPANRRQAQEHARSDQDRFQPAGSGKGNLSRAEHDYQQEGSGGEATIEATYKCSNHRRDSHIEKQGEVYPAFLQVSPGSNRPGQNADQQVGSGCVDRTIRYPINQKQSWAAAAYTLERLGEDRVGAVNLAAELSHARNCIKYLIGGSTTDELLDAIRSIKSLRAEVLNTAGRSRAYLRYDSQLAGGVYKSLPESEWKKGCVFDPDALPN